MASRNLSDHYSHLRRAHRAAQLSIESPSQTLLREKLSAPAAAPSYSSVVDTIRTDIDLMKLKIRDLIKLHTERLKIQFDEEKQKEQDEEISDLTNEITNMIKISENNLKIIAIKDNNGRLIQQERIIRANVMRGLALALNEESKKFRKEQREFLKQIQKQEALVNKNNNLHSGIDQDIMKKLDAGETLTEEQQQELATMELHSTAREQKIIQLAKSINELAMLFQQLNVLVIEQGTVLDRIDYNVEAALEHVKEGRKNVEGAEDYSKKNYTTKCIGCLIVAIFIMFLINVIKHS